MNVRHFFGKLVWPKNNTKRYQLIEALGAQGNQYSNRLCISGKFQHFLSTKLVIMQFNTKLMPILLDIIGYVGS